ncbi:MAG: ImmA/IrrE family metallo-endopeptidase [Lacibacter sp.]|jgi:transcriptional regulator with XRE-family HTH domain/Zn-dependent peptidase ImmA (M78 family)
MNRWDDLKYQRISNVKLGNNNFHIVFENGDTANFSVESILPAFVKKFDANDYSFNSFELIIPAEPFDIEIPWDKIRVNSDAEFSRFIAKQAEEQAKGVGEKLKQLRERKGLKSFEVADRAGLTPQTISRIENGRTDVSFQTLQKILAVMGLDLKDLAEDITEEEVVERSIPFLLKRLAKTGIDSNFLKNKIWPATLQKAISQHNRGTVPEMLLNEATNYLSNIFGWSTKEIWSGEDLILKSQPSELAFFKKPSNANLNQIKAYSHYAYKLAQLVLSASVSEKKMEYPKNVTEFRTILINTYGQITLETVLDYAWDLGICILPLSDSGVFHGAAWNINGRHVVVLKQNTQSHARWVFDLLHELYHVFAHLENTNSSVVETEELTPFSSQDTIEEREANSFANQVVFDGKAEELAQRCVAEAGNIENLKKTVTKIAKDLKIREDFLSNYLAFRLSYQGENWWPTAQKLQITEPNPFDVVKDRLEKRINTLKLNPIESNLLSNALN